jgi:hypothetical protein
MKTTYQTKETQPITLGELCEALAQKDLPAVVEDGYYVFRKGDLKRYTQASAGSPYPMLLELFMPQHVQAAG